MQTQSKEKYQRALKNIRSGDFDHAESILKNLLEAHPDHPDVLHLLGVCHLESRQLELAVNCLRKSSAMQPLNARFQYHYGLSLIQTNQLHAAIDFFKTALEIDNDFTDARYNLAKALKESGQFSEAAGVYVALLNKVPKHIDAMYNLANLYSEEDYSDRALSLYDKLLTIAPNHLKARINLALIKSRKGKRAQAIHELEKVLEIDPGNSTAQYHLRILCSKLIPGWHIDMINDEVRNTAYDKAINAAVQVSDHVLEIGTGSGLLAMMAARAGAKKVTTCEMVKSLAECARKVIRNNGYEDRIKVIAKKSTALHVGTGKDLDEKADMLIAEVFDVGLLGEHFLPALFHARQNLLKEGAVIIPAAARIKGILAECQDLRRVNPIQSIAGFDLSEFNLFRSPGYRQFDMISDDYRALSDPFDVLTIDFQQMSRLSQTVTLDIPTKVQGTCQGVIFWFELLLDRDTLFTSNQGAGSNHWKQAIQFFDSDHPATVNDIFHLEVEQNQTGIMFHILSDKNRGRN